MKYTELEQLSQLDELVNVSSELEYGVLIFKHSTRCAISKMALNRFSRGWEIETEKLLVYFLDLIRHREISNAISERFGVQHESPQVLLIKNGACVYHASHNAISPTEVERQVV